MKTKPVAPIKAAVYKESVNKRAEKGQKKTQKYEKTYSVGGKDAVGDEKVGGREAEPQDDLWAPPSGA